MTNLPLRPFQPDLSLAETPIGRRPGQGPLRRRVRLSLPNATLPPFHAWRP